MCELNQCMEILNLASFEWGGNRKAFVAHTFRVMSRAKNYDEILVAMMHHLYSTIYYAKSLYGCDVRGDSRWRDALDIFVPKRKPLVWKESSKVPDEILLNCNMAQNLKKEDGAVESWMTSERKWSSKYRKELDRFKNNRLARNVKIYDLEDMLETLLYPERFMESGTEYLALPWKKEYNVGVKCGGGTDCISIPNTDDSLFLRPISDEERTDLIEKYSNAIVYLRKINDAYDGPAEYDLWSPERQAKNKTMCEDWYVDWLLQEAELNGCYEEDEDLSYE